MTRLWPEGAPIAVQAIDGQPVSFRWEGRRHAVRGVVDRWAIHDEWWREGQEVWRRYYQVQTADGLLCVLYQDAVAGTWYLERVYD